MHRLHQTIKPKLHFVCWRFVAQEGSILPKKKYNWSHNEQVEEKAMLPSLAHLIVLLKQEKVALSNDIDKVQYVSAT